MKSLSYPKFLQEKKLAETSSSQPNLPTAQWTCPPDSSLSFAQFNRLLADYRRAGYELAEHWRQTASQQ